MLKILTPKGYVDLPSILGNQGMKLPSASNRVCVALNAG